MSRRNRWIFSIFSASAVFASANFLIYSLMFRRPRKHWEQDFYDCAVVCGCQADAQGRPTELLKTRVEKAVELWKDRKVKYLLMSGGAVHNEYTEAEVMKAYAVELGAPESYIVEEKRAISTYHNLKYGAEVMKHCGFKNCVVVTSGWHLRKADHYARKAGVRYVMAAAEEPAKQKKSELIRLYLKTALHMYVNMWKGLY